MEDLSDLTEALPANSAPHESSNAREDADAMDGVSQGLLEEPSAYETQRYAHDGTNDMNDTDFIQVESVTSPTYQEHAVSEPEAATLRLEQFQTIFATQEVELKHFVPPPQCAQHPEQAEDILEAYLDHATFIVKIWVNFDAAENVFFDGSRAAACGTIQIPKAKIDRFIALRADINFRKVRLDICTPFRTLAKIWLDVREKHGDALLEVDGEMVELHPPRQLTPLHDFLTNCVRRLNGAGLDRNLDVQDLVKIARMFRRTHGDDQEEDEWEQPCYGGGEWAGMEKPTFSRGVRW